MKKLCVALIACLSAGIGFCNDVNAEKAVPETEVKRVETLNFAYGPEEAVDIIGLRLACAGRCHDITGLDLTVAGEAQNAYGLQLALARNKVYDRAEALQIALFNNAANRLDGAQISCLNETSVGRGVQLGLVNVGDDFTGVQIGLVNTTHTMYGYQLGLINVIKSSKWFSFLPIINIGTCD